MFDINTNDVKRLIMTQYFLIVVETPVGIFLTRKFPDFTLLMLAGVVGSILISTIIIHLIIVFKASRLIRDFALIFLAICVIIPLTAVMHYIPSIRSALILMYIPSIIFSASQCLSFGVTVSVIVIFVFSVFTGCEYFNYNPIFKSYIDIKSLGSSWQISNLFSFFFIMILSFMANYFFEVLRIEKRKIKHLAELNKKLYQKSKTTAEEIFKEMNEALVVIDQGFKIVQYNNAFKNVTGNQVDLINKNIFTLKVEFINEIKKYIIEAKENHAKNIQFKYTDRLKFNYTINISLMELAKNETGYIILIKKHAMPWGTVFDSVSRKPIDLVLVRLMSGKDKRVMETKVTDREGRFGFIVPAGKYYIFVSKEGFRFPSEVTKEGYKGERIEVKSDSDGVIKIDVPIDNIQK